MSVVFRSYVQHPRVCQPSNSVAPGTWKDALTQVPEADQWAIEHLYAPDEGRDFASALSQGIAIAGSNGSHEEDFGTASYKMMADPDKPFASVTGSTKARSMRGCIQVLGHDDEQESYRAKLSGVAGVVVTMETVCRAYNITSGTLEIGLDGEQAMKAIFGKYPPKVGAASYDLIMVIRRKIKALPITVTGRWVESHTDKHKTAAQQTKWEALNTEVDIRARAFLDEVHLQCIHKPNQVFGDEPIAVWLGERKMARLDTKHLYSLLYGPVTRAYWQQRHSLSNCQMHKIDWKRLGKAMKREPLGKRRWLTKFASGHDGTGKNLLRRKYQDHSKCPRCDADGEDTLHVCRCPAPSAQQVWDKALEVLGAWMTEQRLPQDLRQAIVGRLHSWRKGTPFLCVKGTVDLYQVIAEQDAIGWHQFLLGRVTDRLVPYIQRHFDCSNIQRHGHSCVTQFIRQLWLLPWAMWEHRNDVKHNQGTQAALRSLDQAKQQVKTEFAKGWHMLPTIDAGLFVDKSAVLDMDFPHMLKWLESVRLAREAADRISAVIYEKHKGERQFMERWLQTPA